MVDIGTKYGEHYGQEFINHSLSRNEFNEELFDGCTFEGCDFSESSFSRCTFCDCRFVNCNLSVIKIGYSRFVDVVFDECKLVGVDWTQGQWPRLGLGSPLIFKQCVINASSFYGLHLKDCVIEDCRAHDVDFRGADFSGADFSSTDLLNSLFASTTLISANFFNAINYTIDINNNQIKHARFCRLEAVRLLESLDIELVD